MKAGFPLSSAKIKALKRDLAKLTDVEFLKKELARIADEIKGFDVHLRLSPQANRRLKTLEKRFHELKLRLTAMQKQVDSEVNKIAALLRRSANEASATLKSVGLARSTKGSAKKSGKKKSKKTSSRKAKA